LLDARFDCLRLVVLFHPRLPVDRLKAARIPYPVPGGQYTALKGPSKLAHTGLANLTETG
jgi:hypothetical protein